jgi:hypothetical protein
MKSQTKIWLGVGLVMTGGAAALPPGSVSTAIAAPGSFALTSDSICGTPPRDAQWILVQHDMPAGGEAGEAGVPADLPPDFQFALTLALIRGHLLVGDELVRAGKWDAALPHFLHPTEELYADLKDHLDDYKMAPFEDALKRLADAVKAKKGSDYARALKAVRDALAPSDAGLKEKQSEDWAGFVTQAAIESIKTATGEYQNAIVGGRLAKPVEYQDARGFILEGDRLIESVAAGLGKKDAAALKELRARLAELKKVFPTAVPPRTPVKDYGAMLALVSRVELAASRLM